MKWIIGKRLYKHLEAKGHDMAMYEQQSELPMPSGEQVDFAAMELRMAAAYGDTIYFSTPQSKDADYFARMYSSREFIPAQNSGEEKREDTRRWWPVLDARPRHGGKLNNAVVQSRRIRTWSPSNMPRWEHADITHPLEIFDLRGDTVLSLNERMLQVAEALLASKASQALVNFKRADGESKTNMTRDEALALVNEHACCPLEWHEVQAAKVATRAFGSHYLRQQLGHIQQLRDRAAWVEGMRARYEAEQAAKA